MHGAMNYNLLPLVIRSKVSLSSFKWALVNFTFYNILMLCIVALSACVVVLSWTCMKIHFVDAAFQLTNRTIYLPIGVLQ